MVRACDVCHVLGPADVFFVMLRALLSVGVIGCIILLPLWARLEGVCMLFFGPGVAQVRDDFCRPAQMSLAELFHANCLVEEACFRSCILFPAFPLSLADVRGVGCGGVRA